VTPLVSQLEALRVPPENLHATLCFMGAVAPHDLARLLAVAGVQRGRPAELCFDALEYWHRPRILCATAGENAASAPARELAEQLESACVAAGFTHLTLVRKIHAARVAQCEWPQPLVPPLLVRCDRFVLLESRRGESGSTYSVVDSWPLYAEAAADKSR
jgi:2'-5' RNA ligase